MPKKTALRTRKHRKTSPSKKLGLIARGKNAPQSAKAKSALDNHFHRTDLPIKFVVIVGNVISCQRLYQLGKLGQI